MSGNTAIEDDEALAFELMPTEGNQEINSAADTNNEHK